MNTSRILHPLWICLATYSGCTPHMARVGNRLAADGEWEEAMHAYGEALQHRPGSHRIATRLTYASGQAVSALRSEAVEALAEHDAPMLLDVIARARKLVPDDEGVQEVAFEGSMWLTRGAKTALEASRPLKAHEWALMAVSLTPAEPEPARVLKLARTAVKAKAQSLIAHGRWEDAVRLVEEVEEREPELVELGRSRQLREEGARQLSERAIEASDKQLRGTALVLLGRSRRLHETHTSKALVDELKRQLEERHRFSTTVTAASRDDPEAIRRALLAQLTPSEQTTSQDASALSLSIDTFRFRCATSSETLTGTHRYATGTREVPNPEWLRRRDELERLKLSATQAQGEFVLYQEILRRAGIDTEHTGDMVRDLSEAMRAAEADVARTRQRREAEEDAQRRIELDLESARRTASLSPSNELELELRRLKKLLEIQQDTVHTAVAQERSAQQTHTRLTEELSRATSTQQGAISDHEASLESLRQLRETQDAIASRISLALTRLEQTPATQSETIYDTLRYPITAWTRRCDAEARITMESPEAEELLSIDAHPQSEDRSHSAQPRYGLDEDPMHFAASEADLRARAHEELAIQLAGRIESRRDDAYRELWLRASHARNADAELARQLGASAMILAPQFARSEVVEWLQEEGVLDTALRIAEPGTP